MNARAIGCMVTLLLGIAGCGGSEPRPSSAADTPPPLDDAPSPAASNASGAARADVARGTKALEAGDFATAKAAFADARRKAPEDAEAAYYAGVADEKLGDSAAAEKGYRDALRLRPDLEPAAINLSALLAEAERWDDAVQVARAGLAKTKGSPALSLNLAVALAGKGDPEAPRAFEEAARLAPKDPMVPLTYGHWLATTKKTEAAIKVLGDAERLAPKDVGVVAAVGHELRGAGAFKECVAAFNRAIELKDAAELRTERALCRVGLKDDAGAVADLSAAVRNEKGYAPAHFYLAGRWVALGKTADAQKEYATYLELAPNGPLAGAAKERLAALQTRAPKKK